MMNDGGESAASILYKRIGIKKGLK